LTFEELLERYNLARYNTVQGRHVLPKVANALGMDLNEFITSEVGRAAMVSFNLHSRKLFGDDPETPGAPDTDDESWSPELDKEGKPLPQTQLLIDKLVELIVKDIAPAPGV
jgi:hypothetical protein